MAARLDLKCQMSRSMIATGVEEIKNPAGIAAEGTKI
jgi:hypothetical protein